MSKRAVGEEPVELDFTNPEQIKEQLKAALQAEQEKQQKEIQRFINELPRPVKQRVHVLQSIQNNYEDIRKQYAEELKELEKKYNAKFAPLLKRRGEIVKGESEVTAEEAEKAKEVASSAGGVQVEEVDEKAEDVKGIPDFWSEVLQKSELMGELIQEHDVPSFKYLTDITSEDFDAEEDGEKVRGFHLDFYFAENPFFTNKSLRKTYYMDSDGSIYDFKATPVEWKEDKDLTVKTVIKKQRNKNKGNTRKVKKTEPRESFYNFFKDMQDRPLSAPAEDDEEEGEFEDEDGAIEEAMDVDFEQGALIRDKLIPNAIDYFTGKVQMEMLEDQFMNKLEFMGEDDYGEEDDDEDDEDEEEEKPKKGGNKPITNFKDLGGANNNNQQECKQQ